MGARLALGFGDRLGPGSAKGLPVHGRISRRLARGLPADCGRAVRAIANRLSVLLWGALAVSITQRMPALTFIVVSILRSGLIDVGRLLPPA